MGFKDVVIHLYDGKENTYECVMVELHETFKMLFIFDKDQERVFSCHLEDIMWMEEDTTTHDDPIREQIMSIVRTKGSSGYIQKIPGIKKCRELMGLGLKEAKEQVDKWCIEEGISP